MWVQGGPVRPSSAWRFDYLRVAECLNLLVIQVTEKDKKGQGGGLAEEGEFIDVVEMGVDEVRRLKTFYD